MEGRMELLFAFHTAGLQGGTHRMDPPGPVRPDAAPPARGREAAGLAPRLSGRALSPAPAFRNQFLARYFELFPGQIPLAGQKN